MRSRFSRVALLGVIGAIACAASPVAASPVAAAAETPAASKVTVETVTQPRQAPELSMSIKVFYLEPTELARVSLRRFVFSNHAPCSARPSTGCDASVVIIDSISRAEWPHATSATVDSIANTDSRWPATCEACGQAFSDSAEFQVRSDSLFQTATGALHTLNEAPVGAMWNASWYAEHGWHVGPDGRSLIVRTPGGDWSVDSRASNCTRPDDSEHRCWVRHGDPTTGDIHVDKNGNTCSAGAGSILQGSYHGFLHHGYLTTA